MMAGFVLGGFRTHLPALRAALLPAAPAPGSTGALPRHQRSQ